MSKTLSGSASLQNSFTYTQTNGVANLPWNPVLNPVLSFANGTGANQADLMYCDTRTVTAAAETIDLTSTLTDIFGATLNFAKVKLIIIQNQSTTSGNTLLIGGAATNAWIGTTGANVGPFNGATDIQIIGAGGVWLAASPVDGFATSGTSKNLKVDPGAATITYALLIVGH